MDKKHDEQDISQTFSKIDKAAVLQEARIFYETPIKAGRCAATLSKVLYLLYQGEHLNENESTQLFFQTTRLFQSKDVLLRRLTYLIVKELALISSPDTILMVTSSLNKDLSDKNASELGLKSCALRALVRVVCSGDIGSTAGGLERFLKQAVVDRDLTLVSGAIVSSIHLLSPSVLQSSYVAPNQQQDQQQQQQQQQRSSMNAGRDLVKRWTNEVQDALNKPSGLVQYHGLGLLYQLRSNDKIAILKIVQQLIRSGQVRSPQAWVMLIRYIGRVIEDEGGLENQLPGSNVKQLYDVLEGCLRHRHEVVNLEAARVIFSMKGVSVKELFPVVNVLQLSLNSAKAPLRFSAIRTLNKIAARFPSAVASCNVDLENLITDPNRSIATLAITTLLKTGNESSVDRLLKLLQSFIAEISDEFKVLVVEAIRALAFKFPSKNQVMLRFLSNALRDEGGYEFKRVVVEGLFDFIRTVPDVKDSALAHLCEFIEDCEFTRLAVRILHLLGEEGPKMLNPSKYIRHIYNRTILEVAPVRAAAVASLAKFAAQLPELKPQIMVLLERCLEDPDDEVRDRAIFYIDMLSDRDVDTVSDEGIDLTAEFLLDDSTFAMDVLESQLTAYVNSVELHTKPFDIKDVPLTTRAQEENERLKTIRGSQLELGIPSMLSGGQGFMAGAEAPVNGGGFGGDVSGQSKSLKDSAVEGMKEFAQFGQLFRSSPQIAITDVDVAEYVVKVVKHNFRDFFVVQLLCTNTLEDVMLENVSAQLEPEDEDVLQMLTLYGVINLPQLKYGEPGSVFVVYKKNGGQNTFATGSFGVTLSFITKDVDPETGIPDPQGYDDTYQVDAFEIGIEDYIVPSYEPIFTSSWDKLGNEIVETLQLPAEVTNIKDAIEKLESVLGNVGNVWSAAENSYQLPNKPLQTITSHALMLSGLVIGGVKALCRMRMACVAGGVTVEVAVRSQREDVSQMICDCIG
ncbi:hypothetical protein MP228_005590 [Amoeboaphelidium protococcarum]|nr:hypothetical protein MP228_005590 [Amoeboaphelidium protococcarum]